jgi:hypothetical protein
VETIMQTMSTESFESAVYPDPKCCYVHLKLYKAFEKLVREAESSEMYDEFVVDGVSNINDKKAILLAISVQRFEAWFKSFDQTETVRFELDCLPPLGKCGLFD